MKDERYAERRFDVLKPDQVDRDVLETVPFAYAGRRSGGDHLPGIHLGLPLDGLPDFGELRISYVPRETCVELKSLKYYLNSYRNVGIIQDDVFNQILDDLTALINPVSMTVTGNFTPRGGIKTLVSASYPQ